MPVSTNMYDLDDFSEKVTTIDSAHSVSHSTTNLHGDDFIVSDAAFRKLIWKLDLHLLPPLFLLYFVSLIDRVNIGNARLQGLEEDLGMAGNQFNVALCIIFIGLILFEVGSSFHRYCSIMLIEQVPSNYLVKRISPSLVITAECFLLGKLFRLPFISSPTNYLGLFTIGEGLVQSFSSFTAMRFFIGIMEAGLIPGSCLLLAAYYPRYEMQWRLNMLMVGNAVSSAFGGLIALGVSAIHAPNGYNGWRWIFIIEGTVTSIISAMVYFFMSDWPETASWLTDDEKRTLAERIRVEGIIGRMDKLDRRAFIRCIKDWKIWIWYVLHPFPPASPPSSHDLILNSSIILACSVLSLYSINLFAPTIIKQLHPDSSATKVQSLTIPIFLASAAFSLLIAYLSDKTRHRSSFALLGFFTTLAGLLIMLNQASISPKIRYFALYLISIGAYVSVPALWLLLINNCSGRWKIAIAIGMQTGLGNVGGIASSLIFLADMAPEYVVGWRVSTGMVGTAIVCTCVYVCGMWWENACRAEGKRDWRLQGVDKRNLGDDHPEFRYTY